MREWDGDGVHWDEVLDIVEDICRGGIHREYPMASFGEKDTCGVCPMQTNQVDHMSLNRNGNAPYLMAPSLVTETCNAPYLMAPSLVIETCNAPYLMAPSLVTETCNAPYLMAPSLVIETCNAPYLRAPSLVTETCNAPYRMAPPTGG